MTILLTGSTGYIGRRLLPALVDAGHHVICLVRDQRRFDWEDFDADFLKHVTVVEADLTRPETLAALPTTIDAAYYLVHSMSSNQADFSVMETESATNFIRYISRTTARQIVYLSGIVNDQDLSHHLLSRRNVEDVLRNAGIPVTVLRAAIIVGSGSASFEIIRNLVEKLPVMIAPRWLKTKCQPIAIRNVIEYLTAVLLNEATFGQTFDIGGTQVLTYREMLFQFAAKRKLKRLIIPVPVLTPRLSSLWLVLITPSNYALARNLVNSMKNEVVCRDNRIRDIISLKLMSYEEALDLAFLKIQQRNVTSSWMDSVNASFDRKLHSNVEVPTFGVFTDKRRVLLTRNRDEVIENLWSIGGNRGWYYGNWLWRIRGFMDKMVGGVGLRRGRRSENDLKAGDALDFWRVLVADKEKGRLLLFAEMKLPGEAWLEFSVKTIDSQQWLTQTATFRPLGLWGRLYWYAVLPFHGFIFPSMARRLAAHQTLVKTP